MERSLIVVMPHLPEKHALTIRTAAQRRGFACRFFETARESLPYLADAEVILGSDPFLSRNAPKLCWICTPFAGTDSFMADGAFARPAALLSNSSGAYGVAIAEHVVMVLLELLRRQPEYRAHIEAREWVRGLSIRSVFGSRVTLLGTGDVGRETARRLKGFCPNSVVGVNRSGRDSSGLFDRVVRREGLDGVLAETDVLLISLPGTRETHRMISEKQLGLLPDGAVLVNVGRGSVVDQAALERALRSGRLSAALDVFESEPIPPDSTLWTAPCLIITPHVAGDTGLPYTVDRIVSLFLEDFENYCAGRPPARLVDREAGY